MPDRAGLAFVTLGQPRILPEPGECAEAPRSPLVPQCSDSGWPAPAQAFCHVRHRAASLLHFLRAFPWCLRCGGSCCLLPRWLFQGHICALCVCLFAIASPTIVPDKLCLGGEMASHHGCRRGVEMLPNSCCFVFHYHGKSQEWVWGTKDGWREGWGVEKEGGFGGANCHPPHGMQSASSSACQTFMNIPFVARGEAK